MISDADIKVLEAILASLRVWILALAAALLGLLAIRRRPLGRRVARLLRSSLRKTEYDAKRALFGLAIARLNLPQVTKRTFLPALGYALKRRKCSMFRRFTHGVFHARHVPIRTRIERLRDMLANSETWIARLVTHLKRHRDGMHRILAAPPVARTYSCVFTAPAAADSS